MILFINPRRACAARVTVVVLCVCMCVCMCMYVCVYVCMYAVADPGFLKGGGARSAPQNLAPPTFYILMARAHAHHMNRTEHEHLS